MRRRCGSWLCAMTVVLLAGCAVKTPPMPAAPGMPASFKENANWQPARPEDQAVRGKWWEVFNDPQLNALESQVDVSNQTLRAQEARFQQDRAAIAITASARYPLVTTNPQIVVGSLSGNRPNSTVRTNATDFILPVDLSYELDVWGRVRETINAARTEAQANAADLETVRLSLHADLALDYFELRGLDADRALLDNTVAAFQRALDLTRNRFTGGIASQADVAFAETQLETTRAQAVDVGVTRASLEHAIAELTGQQPSTFTIAPLPLTEAPPDIPAGLPSELLQRRPDIAGAERRIASAAANVGVANAAFFPHLVLTAAAGLESRSLGSWLTGLSSFWTAGPAAAYTIFDAGRRRATTAQAQAAFDEMVADYQETILRSLQDVEDSLASLRILREEADQQALAVAAAERSLTQANNRYRGGVATYLEVIAAQSAALNNQRAAVSVLSRRLAASVLLIKALGGGWDASMLPTLKTDTK